MKKIWTLEELYRDFQIEYIPHTFPVVYEEGVALYQEGYPFLDPDYFRAYNQKYDVFRKYTDIIIEAGQLLAKNDQLLFFVCILSRAVLRFGVYDIVCDMTLPSTQDPAWKLAYDFAPLYALLPSIERTVERMKARNIPQQVIHDTLSAYEGSISTVEHRFGYPGYTGTKFSWMQLTVNNQILSIGRLQYELQDSFTGRICAFRNKEGEIRILAENLTAHPNGMGVHYHGLPQTDDAFHCQVTETDSCYEGYPVNQAGYIVREKVSLPKDIWEKFLSPGDPVVSIHIPRGGSFSAKDCEASFTEAEKIFRECYPDFPYKALFCHSWLMDPQLTDLIKPDSNIAAFRKNFVFYPYEESDADDVFTFVFSKKYDHLEDLPEDTSLMRSLKKHYLDGGYIYVTGGVLK